MHNKQPDPELLDHPNVNVITAPSLDISATMVRKFIKEGKSIRYLIPDAVADLIRIRKFYQ
jgi:nicotinate-nucleotide adenylyltransferase